MREGGECGGECLRKWQRIQARLLLLLLHLFAKHLACDGYNDVTELPKVQLVLMLRASSKVVTIAASVVCVCNNHVRVSDNGVHASACGWYKEAVCIR